jgi:hypothetical protein
MDNSERVNSRRRRKNLNRHKKQPTDKKPAVSSEIKLTGKILDEINDKVTNLCKDWDSAYETECVDTSEYPNSEYSANAQDGDTQEYVNASIEGEYFNPSDEAFNGGEYFNPSDEAFNGGESAGEFNGREYSNVPEYVNSQEYPNWAEHTNGTEYSTISNEQCTNVPTQICYVYNLNPQPSYSLSMVQSYYGFGAQNDKPLYNPLNHHTMPMVISPPVNQLPINQQLPESAMAIYNDPRLYNKLCSFCKELTSVRYNLNNTRIVEVFCKSCITVLGSDPEFECACGNPRFINLCGKPAKVCSMCYSSKKK